MVEEQIRAGYKRTELGIIPDDWEVNKLVNVINYIKGYAFKSSQYTQSGIRIIRVSDTNSDAIKDSDAIYIDFKSSNNFIKWKLEEYDIIISTVGSKPPMYDSMVGKAIIVHAKHQGSLLNQNAVKIDTKNSKIESQLLLYYNLKTTRYLNYIEKIFRGNANQASITLSDLFKFKIPMPKDINEQKRISDTLTDIDNYIRSLEKLIDKKKKIKQATMKQLLKGKKRLPGLSGEWQYIKTSDMMMLKKGCQLNKNVLSQRDKFPVINGGVEPSGYTSRWNTYENTITISEGGNSCGYVNFIKSKFWAGGHAYVVKPINYNINYLFVYYILKYNESKLMALRVGSGLPNIQKKNIEEFELFIPKDIEEQKSIAEILMDFDLEIVALEQKLEKYKREKQGMMQELLTGRIRLI